MENKKKKLSLTQHAALQILFYTVLFCSMAYCIINDYLFSPNNPVYIGPIYLPLLLSFLNLILLMAAIIMLFVKGTRKDKNDELADLHMYKAGYITKYISIFIVIAAILLIKDFNLILNATDMFGNFMNLFVLVLSLFEIVQYTTFIILEKRDSSLEQDGKELCLYQKQI